MRNVLLVIFQAKLSCVLASWSKAVTKTQRLSDIIYVGTTASCVSLFRPLGKILKIVALKIYLQH